MNPPLGSTYPPLNNLGASQLNVDSSQSDYVSLQHPPTLEQPFTDPSLPNAVPNIHNLDSWAQSLTAGRAHRPRDTNNANSAIDGLPNDLSHTVPLMDQESSFPEGSSFFETTSQSMTFPELSNTMFGDDLTFLEDILLPDYVFNATGFVTPVPYDLERTGAQPLPLGPTVDASQLRLFLPKPPISLERSSDQSVEARHPHIFDVSAEDVEQFQKNIVEIDVRALLKDFPFPRRSRILRCLSAYFDHVDPHMPIIQHATFSLSRSSPALVLAMLAMGATITSECAFATSAYEAACTLLDEKLEEADHASATFEFWPIQTLLLCVHFGAFSDNLAFSQRSEGRIGTISKMLSRGLAELNAQRSAVVQDWSTWSFVETFARLASWTCALSAILLAQDHSFHINAPHHLRHMPLPLAEDIWRARSAQEWAFLGGIPDQHSNLDFLTLAESLFQAEPILDKISCFGLFALIGWMLLYICNHERVTISVGLLDMFEADFTSKIDKGLSAWETLTRNHLRTGQVMFQQLSPLISDSFPFSGPLIITFTWAKN